MTSVTGRQGGPLYGGDGANTGKTAMRAIAAPKSRTMNWLQGVTLSAVFQGLPTFAGAALLLKLFGGAHIVAGGAHVVNDAGGVVIFVATTSIFYAMLTPWVGAKFPRFFVKSYEPIFFDASLSFSEKLLRWRTKPTTSAQLLTNVTMLSLLAVAVMSVG